MNELHDEYPVTALRGLAPFTVSVPGSKSITNRALLLAALSDGRCELSGVLFSDDSRAFLDCLQTLGFFVQIDEAAKKVTVTGEGGRIPSSPASIQVRSAGTAARFLSAMLGLSCGEYTLYSSEQMKKRPMAPLLSSLTALGASVVCLEEDGHFPFCLKREMPLLKPASVSVDTGQSSQFLSALLMSGVLSNQGLTIEITGKKTAPAYIAMTLRMMEQFGVSVSHTDTVYQVPGGKTYSACAYPVEPDVSAACYFYAMAALFGTTVTVRGVYPDSMQGDLRFLNALQLLGCTVACTADGLSVTGPKDGKFHGVTVDMGDFSDQTMTMAALAVFADSPTHIKNVAHIRHQESDRMAAIISECHRIGADAEETDHGTGLLITPGPLRSARIHTYDDHRMAMAFSLIGMKVPGIVIDNPMCCKKTFETYFELLTGLCKEKGSF